MDIEHLYRAPAEVPKPTLFCSFCGKNQHEVRKLIAGPTSYICDECVDLCFELVHPADPFSLDARLRRLENPKGKC